MAAGATLTLNGNDTIGSLAVAGTVNGVGAFNAGLGVGLLAYAKGRPREAFLWSWSAAALLLAFTRAWAILSGDRRGAINVATVIEDATLGVGGMWLLRRSQRVR